MAHNAGRWGGLPYGTFTTKIRRGCAEQDPTWRLNPKLLKIPLTQTEGWSFLKITCFHVIRTRDLFYLLVEDLCQYSTSTLRSYQWHFLKVFSGCPRWLCPHWVRSNQVSQEQPSTGVKNAPIIMLLCLFGSCKWGMTIFALQHPFEDTYIATSLRRETVFPFKVKGSLLLIINDSRSLSEGDHSYRVTCCVGGCLQVLFMTPCGNWGTRT